MKLKLLTILILLALSTSTASAEIIPTKEQVTQAMSDYDLDNQNNSYNLACEIGQYVSDEYGWNCDIRQLNFSNHAPVYLDVLYPASDNKKGYEAYYGWFGPQKKEVTGFLGKDKKMYYRDWSVSGHECYVSGLKSYGIVASYYGNVTEENTTDPVQNVTENETDESPIEEIVNNTTEPLTNDSGFEMNIYNETTGAVVDIAAEIPDKVSEEGQKDYLEAVKHFFNAVFGWNL